MLWSIKFATASSLKKKVNVPVLILTVKCYHYPLASQNILATVPLMITDHHNK